MTRPVVAGVNRSPESLAAAHWAAAEALRRGLPLRLVHAWGDPSGDDTGDGPDEPRAARADRVLRRAADRIEERYPQLHLAVEKMRRAPAPALAAAAEDAALLVVGSRGPGAVGGLVTGSVALTAVAHAAAPVVLVRAGEEPEDEHLPDGAGAPSSRTGYRDVAVAVDLGGPSDDLLEFAFHAAELRRARLRVVHAWHVPLAQGLADAGQRARVRQSAEQELQSVLEPWRHKYPGVCVKENLHEGRPAQVLVRAAGGAGLLVAGRRRRRAALGPHIGPVVHALIHHVGRPVAVVAHD
ncbi:universal stress protein [Streptomyces sp. NPDC005931]|uniref:universal stress protein n=1 Tax=Streptomyces sp. NPDC005931 TaxID=3364737 RepID=UPI0036A6337D